MAISWKGISRSPAAFLLIGFFVGAVLTSLILERQTSSSKVDPIFDALSGLPHDPLRSSTSANISMPNAPVAPLQAATDTPKVASLTELLPRLEAKVAAHPDDEDLQILLVRTYLELDQRKKGEALFDKLQQQFRRNEHLPFIRAKMLMQSDAASDLRKAISLLEESTRRRPAVTHLARLYQGQLLLRLGERKQAIKVWRDFINTLAPGDERRTLLEAELEKAASDQDVSNSS